MPTSGELQPEHVEHGRLRHLAQFGRPRDPRLGIGNLAGWPHAAQARRDRDVLLAVHRIGHGRRVDARAHIDLSQHIERLVVEGNDRAVDQPCHRKAARGREHAGGIGIGQLDALFDLARGGVEDRE